MTIFGFVDEIGVTIVPQDVEENEVPTNEIIFEIRSWFEAADLVRAEHKTKVVLTTKLRKQTSVKIRIFENIIHWQSMLTYVGVMINRRLKFNPDLGYFAIKAFRVAKEEHC